MGKASKWFRGLLGLRKQDLPSSTAAPPPPSKPPKEKRRWSFVKSYRENNKDYNNNNHVSSTHLSSGHVQGPTDSDKHAAAFAAATTAAAEAAVAAAAVVRLRSSKGRSAIVPEEWAAVKIQAAFRGCLARRALRALKGLVKLQALVRGHIERKRTAQWLQKMQSLLQANARVRSRAARPAKFSTSHLHAPTTPDKFESPIRSRSLKYDQPSSALKRNASKSRFQIDNPAKYDNRLDIGAEERSSWNQQRSWARACSMDDEKSARILGMDSQKPDMMASSKRRNLFYSTSQPLVADHYYSYSFTTTKDSTCYQSVQSPCSGEIRSCSPLKINEVEYSPQNISTSSKDGGYGRSPFTPTKSDGSRISYLSSYSDYPNYMAYTESSKAKVRSISAPKLRPQYERSTSFTRYSLHAPCGDSRLAAQQRVSALRATSKAYPGSGHLDNLGLPVGYRY